MSYTDVEYKFKKIGKNVHIGKNVYFRYPNEIEIGDNVIIDEFCYFTTKLKIGDYVHISCHCSVIGGINSLFTMEDFTGLSAGCRIICSGDDYLGSGLTNPTIPDEFRSVVTNGDITMKKHSLLGTGCVVHPNIKINTGAVAGSLSLINKDMEEWGIYYGSPAKKLKTRFKDDILNKEIELRKKEKEI